MGGGAGVMSEVPPYGSWGRVHRHILAGVEPLPQLSFELRVEYAECISQKVFITSFLKSQFPHKSVNLSFIIATMKDKLTDFRGN